MYLVLILYFSRASEVINCLDRVHQLKKQEVKPSSLNLKLILEQSGYFTTKSTTDKDLMQHLPAVSWEMVVVERNEREREKEREKEREREREKGRKMSRWKGGGWGGGEG